MKNILQICIVFFLSIQLSAQEKEISGTVTTASDGLPLPGASVIIKGTSTGIQTDFDGKYTITANSGDILVVSYVGMETAEVLIGSGTTYDIALEQANTLDEVVIVGYSKINSSSVLSDRRSPSKSQLRRQAKRAYHNKLANQVQSNSVAQALQGQVSGVNVISRQGSPGTSTQIRIRGYGSINGNSQPLYVIDGQPVSDNVMQSIDP